MATTSGAVPSSDATASSLAQKQAEILAGDKKKLTARKEVPSKFDGQGVVFKAKMIGIESVPASRGDEMCQKALNILKAAVLVAKEHKQKVNIKITLGGAQIVDAATEEVLYSHAVNKISFIAKDSLDSRAFGYVVGTSAEKFEFFAIKTEKAAEQVIFALRELFQDVLELQKKALEAEVSEHQAAVAAAGGVVSNGSANSLPASAAPVEVAAEAVESLNQATPVNTLPQATPDNELPGPVGAVQPVAAKPSALESLLDLDLAMPSVNQSVGQTPAFNPANTVQYGGTANGIFLPSGPVGIPPVAWPAAQYQPPIATAMYAAQLSQQPLAMGGAQPSQWQATTVAQQLSQQPLAMGGAQPGQWQAATAAPQLFQQQAQLPYTQAAFPTSVFAGAPVTASPQYQQWPDAATTTSDPFRNDPFFAVPNSYTDGSASASAVGLLQPQAVRPLAVGQSSEMAAQETFDPFADFDLLGKQGQKTTRREDFFADIKKPSKKSLQEIAAEVDTQPVAVSASVPAPTATNGNANFW